MDWCKLDADIAGNPKVAALSDGAFRAMVHLWAYAMRHETKGRIPSTVAQLVPRVTKRRLGELERAGVLEPNSSGWLIHDWDEHQRVALELEERKARDRRRAKAKRVRGTSADASAENPR